MHTQRDSVMDRTVQLSFFNFSCHHPELLPTLRVSQNRIQFFWPVSSVDSDLQGILYLFFFGFRNLCYPPSALLALFRCFHKLPLARMGAAQAPNLFVCLGLFVLLRLSRRCRRTTVRPFLRSLSYPYLCTNRGTSDSIFRLATTQPTRARGTNAHTLLANKHFTVR